MLTSDMNKRISILKYEDFNWTKLKSVWGKCSEKNSRCVYSQNSVSSLTTMTVSMYKNNRINETNLLQIDGKKYLPVYDGSNADLIYSDIVCAPVTVKKMSIYEITDEIDENRLITKTKTFKAKCDVIFANKYTQVSAGNVYDTENRAFIIIVPKEINIAAGDIIGIDDSFYYVTLCLEYGNHFNEYQIEVRDDV